MKDIKKVKIGIIQSTATTDTARNIEIAKEQIHAAAKDGAQIICLQELFSSLYFCDVVDHKNFQLAEPVPGPTTEQLQVIAAQLDVVIIASLFEERVAGLYHNSTAVIDADGNYLGKYRKSHIPDDPGFYEKFYFAPGDTGYRMFQTKYARIGVLICWDQWYPEAARITALKGAEILFYPTAIGWDIAETSRATNAEQYAAWQTIQRSHAIANGVHVVAVNRTGIEAGTKFWGGSFVANPFGTILYEASHDKNETKVIDIDIAQNEHYRQVWPFLRDRRIDTYKPILKRFL